jgi:hypothetical protein
MVATNPVLLNRCTPLSGKRERQALQWRRASRRHEPFYYILFSAAAMRGYGNGRVIIRGQLARPLKAHVGWPYYDLFIYHSNLFG